MHEYPGEETLVYTQLEKRDGQVPPQPRRRPQPLQRQKKSPTRCAGISGALDEESALAGSEGARVKRTVPANDERDETEEDVGTATTTKSHDERAAP